MKENNNTRFSKKSKLKAALNEKKKIFIKGHPYEVLENGAALVPLSILETMNRPELKTVNEIALDYSNYSELINNFPGLSKFKDLRISIFNNEDDDDSIVVSIVAFTPADIESLGLHADYQLKLAEIISRYDYVEIWSHPQPDFNEIFEVFELLDENKEETGNSLHYEPVGITGFWIYAKAYDSYKIIIKRISDFLLKLDKDIRNELDY